MTAAHEISYILLKFNSEKFLEILTRYWSSNENSEAKIII